MIDDQGDAEQIYQEVVEISGRTGEMKIHQGNDMPEETPLWVFARTLDDDFAHLAGTFDGHRFWPWNSSTAAGSPRLKSDVILWSEASFEKTALYEALLEALESGEHWCERDHMIEDWMHRTALRLVVDGADNAKEIAAIALKSREIDFARYYG